MSTLIVMTVVAALFVAFGLLRAGTDADCGGGSCAACSGTCHRRREPEEAHHGN